MNQREFLDQWQSAFRFKGEPMKTEVPLQDEPAIMAEVEKGERCPVCWEKFVARCRCPRGDKTCGNGHTLSRCLVHNIAILASPGTNTHAVETFDCICHLTTWVSGGTAGDGEKGGGQQG